MITSGTTSVGTVATIIDGTSNSSFRLAIQNNDNTDAVFIGGSGVTITSGFAVQKLATFDLLLSAGAEVYAVSGKTGHVISWLKTT